MEIRPFFDKATSTLTYLVWDADTRDGVLIDPVLDFNPDDGALTQQSVEAVLGEIQKQSIRLHWILETHAHADHLSAAQVVKQSHPQAKVGIGERIREVQATFGEMFHLGPEFARDGRQFDVLFRDGQTVRAGNLSFQVIFTPGHTPACASYYFAEDKTLFSGDALFMPDLGTGRCDFPGASAAELFRSVTRKIYSLDEEVRVCPGHDYPPATREMRWNCSISEQLQSNLHLLETTTKSEYVAFRTARDATLSPPRLLYPSLFLNIQAGQLPPPTAGKYFLKVPQV